MNRSTITARLAAATLSAAALLAAGCASPAGGPRADAPTAPTPAEARSARIVDAATGQTIAWNDLVRRAGDADVVLLGEPHGHPLGLAVEQALNTDLLHAHPNTYALSLEFLDRSDQLALDDALTGVADASDALDDANLPDAHRRMVEQTLEAGRPVIGSNAPRPYVALAREKGLAALEALTPEQRRLVVIPGAMVGGDYRARFFALMEGLMADHAAPTHGAADSDGHTHTHTHGHGHGYGAQDAEMAIQSILAGYYAAQNVWDATMADSLAHAVNAGARPVLHIVGRFHTDHEGGLTSRLRAVRPATRILTISMVEADDQTDHTDPTERPVELPTPSAPRADILIELTDTD